MIAMYDYPGIEKGDLPLCKGQKVIIFDDTRDHWWRARDDKGYVHGKFCVCNFSIIL